MNDIICDLTVKDFSYLFGVEENDMPLECVKIINNKDFRYSFFDKDERDKIILDMMKNLDTKKYSISGKDSKQKWKKGWQEVLDNFVHNGYDKQYLIPQYIRNGLPIRLFGDYVKSYDKEFESNFVKLIITFIFYKYFQDKDSIYEFGCGSCFNLLSFAEVSSNKFYYGCDWVEQSKKIIDAIRGHFNFNIHGGVFNMFKPDYNFDVKENSVALTFGSLEQLGKDFDNFLVFLLEKPFSRYVHINSILEMYDVNNNITDYLTYKFEIERNYCNGFFTKLKYLEKKKIIKIINMNRIKCGGLFGDGYSMTIWEKI